MSLQFCSFNCQVVSARRQRSDLCGLQVKLPLVTTSLSNHSKVEAIPLSVLPKDTTSALSGLTSHYPFLMLNVKSCWWGIQLAEVYERRIRTRSLIMESRLQQMAEHCVRERHAWLRRIVDSTYWSRMMIIDSTTEGKSSTLFSHNTQSPSKKWLIWLIWLN